MANLSNELPASCALSSFSLLLQSSFKKLSAVFSWVLKLVNAISMPV